MLQLECEWLLWSSAWREVQARLQCGWTGQAEGVSRSSCRDKLFVEVSELVHLDTAQISVVYHRMWFLMCFFS